MGKVKYFIIVYIMQGNWMFLLYTRRWDVLFSTLFYLKKKNIFILIFNQKILTFDLLLINIRVCNFEYFYGTRQRPSI